MPDNFFVCLKKLIPMDLIWDSERLMKKFTGIRETDFLSTMYIGNIEYALESKYQINISGDVTRKSKIKSLFEINLTLKDKQYSLTDELRVIKGIAYEEKDILVYDPIWEDDETIPCYTLNRKASLKREVFERYKSKPIDQRKKR